MGIAGAKVKKVSSVANVELSKAPLARSSPEGNFVNFAHLDRISAILPSVIMHLGHAFCLCPSDLTQCA